MTTATMETGTGSADRSQWRQIMPARGLARFIDLGLTLGVYAGVIAVAGLFRYIARLLGLSWLIDFVDWCTRGLVWINLGFLGTRAILFLPIIAALAFHLWNTIWRVHKQGSTLAMQSMGIRVRSSDGSHPAVAAAAIREALTFPVLPALVAFTNPERRTAGDLAARTHTDSRDAAAPPGVARDVRSFRLSGQVLVIAVVGALLAWLFGNLITNLDRVGIPRSFDFLDLPTNFNVPFDQGYDDRSSVRNMVWVGIKNTLLSAGVGIALALVLGTIIGIARLSTNWIGAKLATIYVETFRNIPPLVIIFFFSSALFISGPLPAMTANSSPLVLNVPGSDNAFLILSKTLNGIPSFASDGSTGAFWVALAVGAVLAAILWRWRTKVHIDTGAPHRRALWSTLAFLAVAIVAFVVLDSPYRMSWPSVSENGRRIESGFIVNAPYVSVTLALGMYTASHVAEIIRGAILAVAKGQTEAANALALTGFQRYRFVVLPQAARVAIPPLINQALNLTKNTSLGIAVAYPEITALTQSSIGNGRSAVPSLVVLITVYLTFSLVISLVLNQVNKRFQLVTR